MKETPIAAQAFEDYYDLGDERSIRKLAESNQKHSKHIANLMKWSTEHRWQERVIERDRQKAEAKRKKREAEIDKMDDRQAAIGTTQQATAIKLIQDLIKKDEFKAGDAIRLLKLAIDVERVARGMPTDQMALSGSDGGPIKFKTEWGGGSIEDDED